MNYIINNLKSLEKLKKDKNLGRSFRKIQLDINMPNADIYSKRINKYYFACGCKEGAISVFTSIVVITVIYLATDVPILANWWHAVIYLVTGSLIGKIYGITYNKIMLNKILKVLKRELHTNSNKGL